MLSAAVHFEQLKQRIAGGSVVVAVALFIFDPPPLFPSPWFGLAAAFLAYVIGDRLRISRLRAMAIIVLASLLASLYYAVALPFLTVNAPEGAKRVQIGFYTLDWSLTKTGRDQIEESAAPMTEQMKSACGLFEGYGAERCWKPWTVKVAGSIVVAVAYLALVLWLVGVVAIARPAKASPQPSDAPGNDAP